MEHHHTSTTCVYADRNCMPDFFLSRRTPHSSRRIGCISRYPSISLCSSRFMTTYSGFASTDGCPNPSNTASMASSSAKSVAIAERGGLARSITPPASGIANVTLVAPGSTAADSVASSPIVASDQGSNNISTSNELPSTAGTSSIAACSSIISGVSVCNAAG